MAWQKVLIVAVFVAIVYNLGAALYHMYFEPPGSGRMARSLSWRIGLSVGLIALIGLGIATGVIQPHGVRIGY
jgi:hypothetical protein